MVQSLVRAGVVRLGVMLGLAMTLWLAAVHLSGVYTTRIALAATVDTYVLVVPFAFILFGLLRYERLERQQWHVITSVLLGAGIVAMSLPITVTTMQVYHRWINPEWLDIVIANERQLLANVGATTSQVAERIQQLESMRPVAVQIKSAIVGSLIMGTLVSIVCTAFIAGWRFVRR